MCATCACSQGVAPFLRLCVADKAADCCLEIQISVKNHNAAAILQRSDSCAAWFAYRLINCKTHIFVKNQLVELSASDPGGGTCSIVMKKGTSSEPKGSARKTKKPSDPLLLALRDAATKRLAAALRADAPLLADLERLHSKGVARRRGRRRASRRRRDERCEPSTIDESTRVAATPRRWHKTRGNVGLSGSRATTRRIEYRDDAKYRSTRARSSPAR